MILLITYIFVVLLVIFLFADSKSVRKNTLLHSAWVIIAIVLTIVLGAMAVYYWVLFYPILCKKERKYDVMQMSAKP